MDSPPKCIFHYRKELQAYGSSLENETHAEHLIFLLEYMYQTLAQETERWYNLMELKGSRLVLTSVACGWLSGQARTFIHRRMELTGF